MEQIDWFAFAICELFGVATVIIAIVLSAVLSAGRANEKAEKVKGLFDK